MAKLSQVTIAQTLRIITGIVFVLSAVFKLISIDVFEIYVYSLEFVNFAVSAVFSRLLIAVELLLGILLIFNIHFKKVRIITILLLSVFTIFLLFQIIKGENENCHCFGELLKLSPLESLIKNLVLLVFLFIIKKELPFKVKAASSIFLFATTFSLVLPFFISPPDFLVNYEQEGMNKERVSKLIQENKTIQPLNTNEGKKMICLFSVTCPYCELAANKISVMANKYGFENNIIYLFTGDINKLETFWEASNSDKFTYTFLDQKDFFQIAGPGVPTIYLLENGIIKVQYNYRSLNENEIYDFFGKDESN